MSVPNCTSRRGEAAEQALADVLELFRDPDRLPAAIAQTVIARQAGDSPMASWSLPNQLLCVLAGTTDARGFRQWQDAGRKVTKGARAIRILAPRTRRVRGTDRETGEQVDRVIVTGFLGIPVFRYEDTEGEPLELPDYRPASFPPLVDVADRLGVAVLWAPFTERYRGYYQPAGDRIVLCSHDEAVFFHELAHAAHRRVLEARGERMAGGQNPRQEIVAEVVAATFCRLYGLDGFLGHCRTYVASYVRGDAFAGAERPARAAMRVLADVQAVLALILGEQPAQGRAVAVAA